MNQMQTVVLKSKNVSKWRQGYPLLRVEDLQNSQDLERQQGKWLHFQTASGQNIGVGYLGEQNKGAGWLLATEYSELEQPFFEQLFERAKQKRQSYFQQKATTNAFRLFNGEGDGLGGLIIDYYADFAVFSWYNNSLWQAHQLLQAAFLAVYPEIKGIYMKRRFPEQATSLPESWHAWGAEAATPLVVQENNIAFATYLNEGLMTGIFLDQREVRNQLVEGAAVGQTVLNTFSYTGAFSVAALAGGASHTTSVDLAKRSQPKTSEQFELNGFPAEQQAIRVMDVFAYIRYAKRQASTFDWVILDPPSFARNKKQTFSVAKDYGTLVRQVTSLIAEKGTLVASTNAANVKREKFQEMIEEALAASGRSFKQTQEFRLPADFATRKAFPEGNYLKVFFYQLDSEK